MGRNYGIRGLGLIRIDISTSSILAGNRRRTDQIWRSWDIVSQRVHIITNRMVT